MVIVREVGTFSEVEGLRSKITKMHAHVVQSTHAGMQSMPNIGGLGVCLLLLSKKPLNVATMEC